MEKRNALMKVTEMLVSHHAMLRSVFNEVERAMGEAETTEVIVSLAKVVGGLVRDHAEAESNMLFAPLDSLLLEKGQFQQFYTKHEEYLDMLERVGQPPPGRDARSMLSAAIAALRRHFDVEERVVIPLAEKTFEPESLEKLGEAWLHRDTDLVTLAAR